MFSKVSGFLAIASMMFTPFLALSANAAPDYQIQEERIVVKFQEERKNDSSMLRGEEKVLQEGVAGEAIETVITGGASKEKTLTVTKKPVTKVILVGTSKPTLENLPKVWKSGGDALSEDAQKLRAVLFAKFPEITTIGGYRECDTAGEHCTGRALDIMLSGDLGYKVMTFLEDLHKENAIKSCWNIYEQKIYMADSNFSSSLMSDRGNPTQNHFDHVHAFLADSSGRCSTNGH